MLSEKLLKDKIWLVLAMIILVVLWSMPVVAPALYAESHVMFSMAFALGWSALMAVLGFWIYLKVQKNAQWASAAILLAAASLILLYRSPLSMVQPQFTAEDLCVFFVQQRELGLSAFLTSYNGYYHTVVRFFAALIAPAPTLFVPAFYCLAWLGLYSLVFIYILMQYPDRKLAPVFALVTACVSHTAEIFFVVTDAIWLAGLALTVFILLPVPELKKWPSLGLAAVLLIFSITGPFSLVLVPFYVLRWILNRKSIPLIYVLAVAMGALIQFSSLHSYYADKQAGLPPTFSTFLLCLKVVVVRVPWSLMVGYQPQESYWLIGLPFIAVLFVFMGKEIMVDFRKHIFTIGCLFLAAVYVALDIFRISPLDMLVPLINGDRYFYIPKVLFVWALLYIASIARNPRPFYIALTFCVLGSIVEFCSTQKVVDNHWPKYAVLIDQGNPVRVPVNPPGSWYSDINTHPTTPR